MVTWTPTKSFVNKLVKGSTFPQSARLVRWRRRPKDATNVEAKAAVKTAEILEAPRPRPHLDAQNVGAGFDELVGQLHIVIQGVLLPARVRDVARVRDGSLHNAPCCPGRLHAQQHVWDVVQGVKHAEDVHAVLLGHLTEPGEKRGRRRKGDPHMNSNTKEAVHRNAIAQSASCTKSLSSCMV